jgi:hypothetical protein
MKLTNNAGQVIWHCFLMLHGSVNLKSGNVDVVKGVTIKRLQTHYEDY